MLGVRLGAGVGLHDRLDSHRGPPKGGRAHIVAVRPRGSSPEAIAKRNARQRHVPEGGRSTRSTPVMDTCSIIAFRPDSAIPAVSWRGSTHVPPLIAVSGSACL